MNWEPLQIGVYFQRLHSLAHIPFKRHGSDAGWDLFTSRHQMIPAERVTNVHTDLAIGIPEGWSAHLVARSSTIRNYGIQIVDAIIDAGYRGELFIQTINMTHHEVAIRPGIRIAQLVFVPVPEVTWREVLSLPGSNRGAGGFGSTGT